MSKNPLVSIILPIYNMEQYLKRAIESAINQTYKNIEIILVNDGSTDSSAITCDEYLKKDNRIKVIHQENSGVSKARNVGIKSSQGKYIQFMDPDDYYELTITQKLVDIATKQVADFVICAINLITIKNGNTVLVRDKTIGNNGNYNNIEIVKKYYSKDILMAGCIGHVCNKLYSSEIITTYNLMFNEDIIVNEDDIFNINYLSKCNKIYYLNEKLYNQHIYDRITGSNRYWANTYEDSKYLFEILRQLLKGKLTESEIVDFESSYANKIITAVVILCRLDTIYTDKELFLKLKTIVNDNQIQNSLKYYKRYSKRHSYLIPLLIKLKLPFLLMLVAKRRAFKRYGNLISFNNNI